jgi:hypothetical protein
MNNLLDKEAIIRNKMMWVRNKYSGKQTVKIICVEEGKSFSI